MEYVLSVAVAMREWKTRSGASDSDITKATGLDRTTVSRLRLGYQIPQPSTVRLLCQSLEGFEAILDGN